jgi:pSer/pThr/pTyr-binding forkhead associated (FHA) protein
VRLVCIEGSAKDSIWEITGKRVTIGRDPNCDINIDDPGLSRTHAEIICDGDRLLFVDLISLNGSMINGKRVRRRVLAEGDTVRIGESSFLVLAEDTVEPFMKRSLP